MLRVAQVTGIRSIAEAFFSPRPTQFFCFSVGSTFQPKCLLCPCSVLASSFPSPFRFIRSVVVLTRFAGFRLEVAACRCRCSWFLRCHLEVAFLLKPPVVVLCFHSISSLSRVSSIGFVFSPLFFFLSSLVVVLLCRVRLRLQVTGSPCAK